MPGGRGFGQLCLLFGVMAPSRPNSSLRACHLPLRLVKLAAKELSSVCALAYVRSAAMLRCRDQRIGTPIPAALP
jgi:hypothetical protein